MRSVRSMVMLVLVTAIGCGRFDQVSAQSGPFASKLGVELDGLGDGSREKPFVDLARTLRTWTTLDGSKPAPLDRDGWPVSDAQTVLFDIRPFGAWAPPQDDPEGVQPDWGGVYKVSFLGLAEVQPRDASKFTVGNQTYDSATNTTTLDLTVSKGSGLLVVAFSKTRRNSASQIGSGISRLRIIRPGYPANTKQTFTNEFLLSLRPFQALRYMDWLSTNHNPGFYGDTGHHALHWSDRRLPTDAVQVDSGGKYGIAWELIVELANTTRKDLWINVPVAADDDYVVQLAKLLKSTLRPELKVYVEHSNEVWNFGFPQYIYNKLAAVDEVKLGASKVNNDGTTDQELWARRRHAARTVRISEIFRKEFNETTPFGRVRPVYASWTIFPDVYYAEVLNWVKKTFGDPKNYFYGMAGATYYNAEKASKTATVDEILNAMYAAIDENFKTRKRLQQIAENFGIKHCLYEIGPDTGGGKVENVANRIRANRSPRMKDLILHDARDCWFNIGGDMYMYFAHSGSYSRYGCWGLSEYIEDLDTSKWRAIYELTGVRPSK